MTPNIRADAGKAQTWRDYQQVLSELGLIFSTRFTENVVVTPMGLMWLDGILGFSELMATQAFRYQYPNGHKLTIPPRTRGDLSLTTSIPETRTELDDISGVAIKPAVLILRLLLEGMKDSLSLTVDQCVGALMPLKKNSDWRVAQSNLDVVFGKLDQNRRRHVQEWYRLLARTGIFIATSRGITLTENAKELKLELESLCEYHENVANFWKPQSYTRQDMAGSWSKFYSNPNIDTQWAAPVSALTQEFVAQNYPMGIDLADQTALPNQVRKWSENISLREVRSSPIEVTEYEPGQINLGNLALGYERRREMTLLHDVVVLSVANRLKDQGYVVQEDPSSVDILAIKNGHEIIFEIKTVNIRSLPGRIRLGVGQLSEYRYRRELSTHNRPKTGLIISGVASIPEWVISYFNDELNMSLVAYNGDGEFVKYTSIGLESLF